MQSHYRATLVITYKATAIKPKLEVCEQSRNIIQNDDDVSR